MFAFITNIPDSITRNELVIVRFWMEGAVVMLLHPLLKDGHFIVSLGELLLELNDGRELFV